MLSFQFFDQFDQAHQVFEPHHRPAARKHNEWIG
jgi:hypothetical protein